MYPVKQSTALTVPVFAHDVNGDAVTGLTDVSFTKRISKNGAAFGAMTVTLTEMENGWYSMPLSTAHTDTLGVLSITLTNAGAKQINMQFRVHARIPDDLAYPTVSGRSLDVTATGAAGIDWGNVENPTTVVDLSGTDINLVDTCTTNTDMRGTDSALLAASAPTNFSDMAITVTTGEVTVGTNNDKTGYTVSTVSDKTGYSLAADQSTVTVGTVTTLTGHTAQTGDSFARLGAPVGASISADIQTVDANVDAVLVDTASIGVTKNAVFNNFEFPMVLTSDHYTAATSKTVTGERSIDGGAFVSVGGAIAEVGSGIYQFDALAADTNGDVITWKFSAADCDDTTVTFKTRA
ncbi:MAG: hypothetical protein OES84_00125 [Kiritimatiellaceae bacterium]|nr:hypothetical protein [Kiritimatiellaceae bacterium]